MRQESGSRHSESERVVKDIRRKTRKQYSAEEKIRIVLDGLRGEDSIAELCRGRVLHKVCIINGPRTFWKQARNDWLAILFVKPTLVKSKICAMKLAS